MALGREVELGPGDIVLAGDPALHGPKGAHPQFSAHVCHGQMAVWMNVPLGMEISFSPGDIVRWGSSSP